MKEDLTLTHLSLFSGIGGLDLAAEWAGFTTVGQCEWADYPTKILEKHWPNTPRWRDIRTLTGESFYEKTGLRTVDVISGGFPCQPFSYAGKRRGKEDDRYLWPEMLRVIRELRPSWVVGENVPGIVNLALDTVLADLENEGYATQAFIVPACGVDAPHRRNRVAILANRINGSGTLRRYRELKNAEKDGGERNYHRSGAETAFAGERREDKSGTAGMADGLRAEVYGAYTDTDQFGLQRGCKEPFLHTHRQTHNTTSGFYRNDSVWGNWPPEPGVDRVVDGIPDRVDRIKCLGNAVVPQQFFPFFYAIHKIEVEEANGSMEQEGAK